MIYAFPDFSLMQRCIRKLEQACGRCSDSATDCGQWQCGFHKIFSFLIQPPALLSKGNTDETNSSVHSLSFTQLKMPVVFVQEIPYSYSNKNRVTNYQNYPCIMIKETFIIENCMFLHWVRWELFCDKRKIDPLWVKC